MENDGRRTGSVQQHRADDGGGDGGRVRRHPVAAHQLVRRGAGAALEILGAHRAQHADHPPRGDRHSQSEYLAEFTGFTGLLSGFTGFYRVLPGFTGFYWVSRGFTGFHWVILYLYWVSLGLTGIAWVYLDFIGLCCAFTVFFLGLTGLYYSFTGFYWVLLGSTVLLLCFYLFFLSFTWFHGVLLVGVYAVLLLGFTGFY